ncbi:hypothetical protein UPYG_G00263450 [Umbra pygmaea]|uniref:Interleukin-34 n=1 Tax=Umbra pygmaea TaxID=75934 RepID=A0ABD0WE39_UMBPY
MVRSTAWLLGGLLGLMWVLPALMAPSPTQCTSLKTLENKLANRRHYMKHNLPINYTIRVHYEEVFKLSNISRLRVKVKEEELKDVWLLVNQEVLKKIMRVLPERHPSYKYTVDLEDLFRKVQQVFPPPSPEIVPSERIEEIFDRVKDTNSKGRRFVTPKSLLDNCYRTMHCLFKDCFRSEDGDQDYCGFSHWRKGRKKQPQDT